MSKHLRDNLTSSYFTAAHKLYPKKSRRKIVAYVESYEDIPFWRGILEEFETDDFYFQVMPPSSTSLAKGKKMVLMNSLNTDALGESLIACVDSDYDFLLQGSTPTSHLINSNPYIFQTYAYAIENYHCYAESLHEVCVQSTLNDREVIDYEAFLKQYSEIVYPLFLWNIWFYKHKDTHTFSMTDFHQCVKLREVCLQHPEKCLETVQHHVQVRLHAFEREFPDLVEQVKKLGKSVERLGLVPETTYLYMQGHHIMDNVVLKLLNPVCVQLRREREEEIKRLAWHDEQFRNELTCYENSQVNIEVMLRRNVAYYSLYLYQWLREDLENYVAKLHG